MKFNEDLFQKQIFDSTTIKRYLKEAETDLGLAYKNPEPRAQFWFVYSSLLKCGIGLLATMGYRIKSKEGHHILLMEKISEILEDPGMFDIGNTMRQKRNKDAYRETVIPSESELKIYLEFVDRVFKKTEEYILKQEHLF